MCDDAKHAPHAHIYTNTYKQKYLFFCATSAGGLASQPANCLPAQQVCIIYVYTILSTYVLAMLGQTKNRGHKIWMPRRSAKIVLSMREGGRVSGPEQTCNVSVQCLPVRRGPGPLGVLNVSDDGPTLFSDDGLTRRP